MTKRSVLITGCSKGGLAQEMVKAYLRRGFLVLATLRDLSKAGDLGKLDNVKLLKLNVASQSSIKSCFDEVQGITGGRLDVLVNNAGSGGTMPLLDVKIEEAKEVYDANVWGILAMTQAFTPMLIEAHGVVCNISSVLGELVYAWAGTVTFVPLMGIAPCLPPT
jgi:NAD(P)-dependent dehydrogenase (short-subunit alcohol dehydrogenase family)